jgi:hypothetical protein
MIKKKYIQVFSNGNIIFSNLNISEIIKIKFHTKDYKSFYIKNKNINSLNQSLYAKYKKHFLEKK